MRKTLQPFFFLLFLAIALVTLAQLSHMRGNAKELVPWREGFEAAKAESAESGKPIVAYFTADWCGPCQVMKRTVWSDPTVEAALREFVPVKIDVDAFEQLAFDYRIRVVPTIILMDSTGKSIRETQGSISSEALIAWLKEG